MRDLAIAVWVAATGAACGFSSPPREDVAPDAEPAGGEDAEVRCLTVDDTAAVVVASATTAEDYGLILTARADSATAWSAPGNEAVVLEIAGSGERLIGHLVLHQGQAELAYGMAVGALAAGEPVSVRVSALSADGAARRACVQAVLAPVSTMGAAGEGVINAPIFRWPVQKRFDDLPLVLGWSWSTRTYETVFSNENGGTVAQCGGGAGGIQAQIARWGRAADLEASYEYGAAPRWERCTGMVGAATTPIRTEGSHPILYYGDGHNRLFESRGGYGQACGAAAPEKPDGDLAGWNTANPSNALADDAGKVIILRPLPVDLDALDYDAFRGRREALIDRHAPWLYGITSRELAREGKIDGTRSLELGRYLYADVLVADVQGGGDAYCGGSVGGGFKLRAITADGSLLSGPQITVDYTGTGHDWKRIAIPLPAGTRAADIARFQFDAYDQDGIFLTAIGDAFIAEPDGANGATLAYVRRGEQAVTAYVDDDSTGCVGGFTSDGPGGARYTCVGGVLDVAK